ncbi:ABC transporter ATP-binding protein [Vibrio ostreicida]|uniref:ABC transporter ATP-binding protein n=1 Tax=Vibrio ostreicida TaxID=526588 RepID=A0ABT8C2C4_9VIBR|nr:ABC transporter ATP-binding protein [Vibrio ostreicida]MDN3612365.1 ABC transporter ATP-binding protein [Vibrio ostreicida]NPD09864.1 ABC transporter ATP-binding protein [Vibrio ostreicida]
MNKVQQLIRHSGAKTTLFWYGLLGKIATEFLPVLIWLVLFSYFLSANTLSLTAMVWVSVIVVAAQWALGQTTKFSFLGAYEITHGLRSQLLKDIRRQPLATLKGKRLGEKVKLLTSDLKQFEDIFSHMLAEFLSAWVIPFAMLVVLLWIQPLAGLALLGVFSVAFGVLIVAEKGFSRRAEHYHSSNMESANQLLEYIDCLPMLRGFGRSDKLAVPLCHQIEEQRKQGLGLEWAGGLGVLIATLILEFALIVNLTLCAWLIDIGKMTQEQFLVVVVASVACIRPLARMAVYAALLRYMLKAAGRLHQLSCMPQQQAEGTVPSSFDVALTDVHLSLDNQPILNGVSLTAEQGQHIALVGKSGSGKSTLLDVIAAFHIPSHGRVLIGQQSVDEVGTVAWYRHLSYVTQDVQLLGGSLRDNLLLANPKADDRALWDVIEAAGLSDLVAKLPLGLDSPIGENGGQLSGGERQRLSIARALLHDAPILLLDEMTSALDQDTQNKVLAAIETLAQGKTVISVAHRLDTIEHADKIYVMERGQVTGSGKHSDLVRHHRQYKMLWQAGQST